MACRARGGEKLRLVSFYDLIDHDCIFNCTSRHVRNVDLAQLLRDCLEKWTEGTDGHHLHHGIPQGPEPSAFLAECILFRFDALRLRNVTYLRYVDDIKLMGKAESPVRRALLRLDIESKRLGLVPQAQKIGLRRATSLQDLIKTAPSHLQPDQQSKKANASTHRKLVKVFHRSMHKEKRQWHIDDVTKFKFSLFRMNADKRALERVGHLLVRRPDLSPVFGFYMRKFPSNRQAADILVSAVKDDPIYDATASDYIEAMDICIPRRNRASYEKVIRRVEARSEEKSIQLNVAVSTFRGKRMTVDKAANLIARQKYPLAKSILIHRLFGLADEAPFKAGSIRVVRERETCSEDEDLSRFCASFLLEDWPWSVTGKWSPPRGVNDSVKILMKGLGLRRRLPKRRGVLDTFFQARMKIGMDISWQKALGKDLRDGELKCLRLQRFQIGDPTSAQHAEQLQ